MEGTNRISFFGLLSHRSSYELERIQLAYWLSKNVHRVQTRDSGERYFEHPRRVALILMDNGIKNTDVIIDALLHDVLEDTYTPSRVLIELFGGTAYKRLVTLSKQLPAEDRLSGQIIDWVKKTTEDYYRDLTLAEYGVRLVKCADRLDNLRSCRNAWPQTRIEKYLKETEAHVIPLAQATDQHFLEMLQAEIVSLRSA
jgi:GTP pyrophosphokinase